MNTHRSRQRYLDLLAAHGADPARWPEAERDWMQQQSETDHHAARHHAALLDTELDLLAAPDPSASLRRAILDAVARDARIAEPRLSLLQSLRALWGELGGVRLAGPAFAMALAAGVSLGWMLEPMPPLDDTASEDLLALAQFDDSYTELIP